MIVCAICRLTIKPGEGVVIAGVWYHKECFTKLITSTTSMSEHMRRLGEGDSAIYLVRDC